MTIHYDNHTAISSEAFIDVLKRSGLAARRPVDDPARIAEMLTHANLLVTAWNGEALVGVARALTDFSYCCYLSDLAVDRSYQKQGIGKKLIEETHRLAGPRTSLILVSAPNAAHYYPHIGMEKIETGYMLRRSS